MFSPCLLCWEHLAQFGGENKSHSGLFLFPSFFLAFLGTELANALQLSYIPSPSHLYSIQRSLNCLEWPWLCNPVAEILGCLVITDKVLLVLKGLELTV